MYKLTVKNFFVCWNLSEVAMEFLLSRFRRRWCHEKFACFSLPKICPHCRGAGTQMLQRLSVMLTKMVLVGRYIVIRRKWLKLLT